MERTRRRGNIKRKKTSVWKRCMAAAVAAVTVLTGLNYDGLTSVFAEERSGYEIGVSYSEDMSQAVLMGNTENVPVNTTLTGMTGADGTEYDPNSFNTTVTENGTYTYTLKYSVTAEKTGQSVEHKETLKVTVDQIAKPEGVQAQSLQVAEQPETNGMLAGESTGEGDPQNETQGDAPSVMALNTLLAAQERAGTEAVKMLYLYSSEAISQRLSSTPFEFSGGELNAETAPKYNEYSGVGSNAEQREFSYAAFIYTGTEDAPYPITGLYYYEDEAAWYYTTAESTDETEGEYGQIAAAYLLPDNTEIRLYYGVSEGEDHTITVNIDTVWNMSGIVNQQQAKRGQRIVFEATLSTLWQYGYVTMTYASGTKEYSVLRRTGSDSTVSNGDLDGLLGSGKWVDAELMDEENGKYRISFIMPGEDVTISATPVNWPGGKTRWFGIAVADKDSAASSLGMRGATRFYTTHINGTRWSDANSDNKGVNVTGGFDVEKLAYGSSEPVGNMYDGFYEMTSRGAPFIMYEWAAKDFLDYSEVRGSSVQYMQEKGGYNLNSSGNGLNYNASLGLKEVVMDPLTGTKRQIPVGQFTRGQITTFRIEESKGVARGNSGGAAYEYIPQSLTIDVWEGDTGYFGNNDFTRWSLNFPTSTENGKNTTSITLPDGGKITIICRRNGGTQSATEAKDYWGSSLNVFKQDITGTILYPGGLYRPFTTSDDRARHWYVYDVVVEGMTQAYKLTYNHITSSQSNFLIGSVEGVVESQDSSNSSVSSDAISNSYISAKNDNSSSNIYQEWRPLRSGSIVWGKHVLDGGYIQLGLKQMEGYSRPTVTGTARSGASITPKDMNQIDSKGRWIYNVTLNSNGDSNGYQLSGVLSISAKPVNFYVQYKTKGGLSGDPYYPSDNPQQYKLTYDGTENHIVGLHLPDSNPIITGYKMQIRYSGSTLLEIPGSHNNLWLPGDLINVRTIYQKLQNEGKLQAGTDYYIVLVPEEAGTLGNGTYTDQIPYSVYEQSGWVESYGNGTETSSNNGFTASNGTIGGFIGSDVVLGGYVTEYTDSSGKMWMLDETSSQFKSQVTYSNGTVQKVGWLYYVLLATAKIEVPNEISGLFSTEVTTAINTWNSSNVAKQYVGVNTNAGSSLINSVDLSSINLPAELSDGRKLVGWRVKYTNSGDQYSDVITPYDASDSSNTAWKSVNLYELGRSDQNAWNASFNTGTIILEPYYESSVQPITVPQNGESQFVELYNTYDFSTEFAMSGQVIADSTTRFAAFRSENNGVSWGILAAGQVNFSGDNLNNGTVNKVTGNQYYGNFNSASLSVEASYDSTRDRTLFTFKVSGYSADRASNIYRIYLWNDGNGNLNPISGGAINTSYSSYDDKNSIENSAFASYPYVDTKAYLIPQVQDYGNTTTTNTPQEQSFHDRDKIEITGSFSISTPYRETLDTMLNNSDLSGELKVALYKKNPGTDTADYQMFALAESNGDGTLNVKYNDTSMDNTANIQLSGNNFTVTFTKTAGVSADNGAEYRIYVWTETNDTSSLPANFGRGEANVTIPVGELEGINTIPSVSTKLSAIKITLTEEGDMQKVQSDSVNVYQQDDGTYEMTATFYMKGDVGENSTATYAVYAQEEGKENWGLTERGTVNLSSNPVTTVRTNTTGNNSGIYYGRFVDSNLAVSRDATTGKITMLFSNITDLGSTGIDYRIYLWNTANGDKDNNRTDIPNQYADTTLLDGSFTDSYARNWQELHIIPEVTTEYNPNIIIEDTPKSALFYESTQFTVRGTFKLEGAKRESFDYLNSNDLIRVALYKQNPNDSHDSTQENNNDFAIWADNDGATAGHSGKIGTVSINKVSEYEFTVSIAILNNGSSISYNWDEASRYRIYAWTESNGSVDAGFGTDNDRIGPEEAITTVPSTTTTMTCVLGDQFSSMISYPKEIIMSDNADQYIYSGTQVISITPLTEETVVPNPDPGVDVTIQELISSATFNIRRSLGNRTENIALQGFRGAQPNGSTSSAAVDIHDQNGVVGTMKFSTDTTPNQNKLQLYFKSEKAVTNLVDAGAFTGQINFQFSKANGS